jgi:D-tyrosyl-tRNA(Tyr) deacylase
VRVEGQIVGSVGKGMVIFVGVMAGDGEAEARKLASRIARFRFFPDGEGRMNLAAAEVGAGVLVISQFTLAADGRKGRRPSFDAAARPEIAEPLYELFAETVAASGLQVARGVFGAHMEVECLGDGPVTFSLEENPPDANSSQTDASSYLTKG